jgi:flagellar hook protein FlgE
MFAAISGLRSHQTMMDVVGNNLANVNTIGYKSSRATFQESLTQVERGASGPAGAAPPTAGGVNPFQVGLGVRVASVDTNFAQGSVQVTGRRSDVAINGEGFFRIEADGVESYMRGGAFSWDADGNLVTPDGGLVLDDTGTPITVDPALYTDPSIASNGQISARDAGGVSQPISVMGLARFANSSGLTRIGNGLYQASPNSGVPIEGPPNAGGMGFLQSGTVEMSNVDLAAEFTNMIIAQRGLQANSRTITSSDEILQELVNLKR